MSVIQNNLLLAGDDGYNLTRSLRFRSSASSYLNRTPASAGNRQKWTWSGWVKRGSLGVLSPLFSANPVASSWNVIRFNASDILQVGYDDATLGYCFYQTSAVFRDPSSWYHVVIASDTTQSTAANRVLIYVNGVQQTTSQAFASQVMPQNFNWQFDNTVAHRIGSLNDGSTSTYFDGYIAEQNFIDGQALTPSSFGQTSPTTGVWQPKKYTGTYGTNGFYLPFTDNSALTSGSNAGLGKDFSGNGNYWNTNNISITAGSTYDSMTDVPTLTSATAANFSTLNPVAKGTQVTLANANLLYSPTASATETSTFSTIGMTSGKWYCEFTAGGNDVMVGLSQTTNGSIGYIGINSTSWGYYGNTGQKYNNNSATSYGATYTTNDVIGIAFDADNGTLTFYKNNTSQGTAYTGLTSGPYFFAIGNGGGSNSSATANFGQRPFAYTPPTGYVALNTFNLPTPTIGATASSRAGKYFNAVLYAGTSPSTNSVTGVGFQPDLVWVKSRTSGTRWHENYDVLRPNKKLSSNATDAEYTENMTFDADGFTTSGGVGPNETGNNYVGWCWKANGTGVTNTAGSITSTVSANTTSGFSVVTFTATGSNATVGHGLGVAPKMIITKQRSTTGSWATYHESLGNTKLVYLNSTGAALGPSSAYWNNTSPTSSVFTFGGALASNTDTIVAYCFSEVAGYSKAFSYTGNGSSDGAFVFCGFKPRWIIVKSSSGAYDWIVWDSARNTFNVVNSKLSPNTSGAEFTDTSAVGIDLLSNGFKIRGTDNAINANGASYIGFAFSENPFKYSLGK